MSSVCGKLNFKDADFEISTSSPPTQCSNDSKHSSHAGSEESDGDETGYINHTEDDKSASKDLGKSALESIPLKSSDVEDKDENLTATPVVVIPAIKGSRKKHGLTLKKTTVSWADDVYDPPPSIASHTRNKKQQQQQKSKSKDNHKKTGKKGQKNSSSRSGKDKKQSAGKHSRDKFDWATQVPIVAASS